MFVIKSLDLVYIYFLSWIRTCIGFKSWILIQIRTETNRIRIRNTEKSSVGFDCQLSFITLQLMELLAEEEAEVVVVLRALVTIKMFTILTQNRKIKQVAQQLESKSQDLKRFLLNLGKTCRSSRNRGRLFRRFRIKLNF